MISGARQARPSFVRRLVARAQARELAAFVVPGPEATRALGVDLGVIGLQISHTPRHASVLVLVGELPPGLKKAAAVAYAQTPRPRAILAVGTGDVSPLPEPNVSARPRQEDVATGVAELRRLFAQSAFSPETADFDVDVIRTQAEYVCSMHPEAVRSEPGSCPICGMDLIPREAAGEDDHSLIDHASHGTHHEALDNAAQGHHEEDHGSHGGMDHGDGEEGWDDGHEALDHGHMDQGGYGQEGASHGKHDYPGYGSTEHASADEGEADANPDGAGDSEHGAHGEHEGHDQHAGMEHGEQHENHEHTEHSEHGHMDHGDMGFMSMVEMTKDLPRSSDGLQMEWVEDAPFGPLFPGLPGGLTLTLTLDGDTVARAEAEAIEGRPTVEDLTGSSEEFVDRLARLDPLSPVAYRVLALRALESAAGVEPEERIALARVGALERERAASHLGWLSIFGRLLGYSWLEHRAGRLQVSLVRAANADEIARLWVEAGRLARRVEKTPLLRRKLGGVGLLPEEGKLLGPVARAAGVATDSREDEEVYRTLDFEPVVRDGNDVLSRLTVRLAEIEQSLELVGKVGKITVAEPVTNSEPLHEGSAMVETSRGAATLCLRPGEGAVNIVELDEPSARHLKLVGGLAEQRELADALVGVASLDLSPWGVAR